MTSDEVAAWNRGFTAGMVHAHEECADALHAKSAMSGTGRVMSEASMADFKTALSIADSLDSSDPDFDDCTKASAMLRAQHIEIEQLGEEVASLRNALNRYFERPIVRALFHDSIMELEPAISSYPPSYSYGYEEAKNAAGLLGAKADTEIARLTVALKAAQDALRDAIQDCKVAYDKGREDAVLPRSGIEAICANWLDNTLLNVAFGEKQAEAIIKEILKVALHTLEHVIEIRYNTSISGAMRWACSQEAPIRLGYEVVCSAAYFMVGNQKLSDTVMQ
jgi:hypothetical protein